MLAWRHSGFTVHNQVRVAAGDAEGRKSLAGYMLHAPCFGAPTARLRTFTACRAREPSAHLPERPKGTHYLWQPQA
jgi:hypothetical protein